jgi:outer membrane protein assembly factor BamA
MSFICMAEEKHVSATTELRIPLAQLEAASVALKQFKVDQPKVEANTFYVVIDENSDTIEIDFVPNQTPIDRGENGDSPYIAIPSGSGNKHGRNIRYLVSKARGTIVKTVYPR